jgi:hypothetical protein
MMEATAVRESKMALRPSYFTTALAGMLVAAVVGAVLFQMAKHKDFWFDEAYEVASLYEQSVGGILRGDTFQANKNPLYFALQRLVLARPDTFDSRLLVRARLVSMAAALLVAMGLFLAFRVRMGFAFAAFGAVSLVSHKLFYEFATEARPYMLWLALFAALVFATSTLCARRYEEARAVDKILFGLSAVAVTAVIATGVIQSALAVLTCLWGWYFLHEPPASLKALTHFALPLLAICAALELYYALRGLDAFVPYIKESSLDLWSRLAQGDFSLLKMPPRILFPKVPRDAYTGVWMSNLLVLAGLGFPWIRWKERRTLDTRDSFALALAIALWIQILATVVIMIVIACLRYWFVQRLFLHLLVCHAMLATIGFYFVMRSSGKSVHTVMKAVLVILLALSAHWHWKHYLAWERALPPEVPQPVAEGKLPQALPDYALYQPPARLKTAMEISRRLEAHGWAGDPETRTVYLWESSSGDMNLGAEIPAEGQLSRIGGRPISFSVKERARNKR